MSARVCAILPALNEADALPVALADRRVAPGDGAARRAGGPARRRDAVSYRRRVGTSKVTGRPWATVKAAGRMSTVLLRYARETR